MNHPNSHSWLRLARGGLLVGAYVLACGGPEEFRLGDAGPAGSGGRIGTGGAGTGGATGTGSGGSNSGGTIATGGRGSGGAPSAGGAPATGGRGTGGVAAGSGGRASGGSQGASGGRGTGGRGSGGADDGTGGRGSGGAAPGSGGRGSGGAAGGGRGTGGAATGGRGTGGAAATGPCAALCDNPVTVAPKTNSGALGTSATCHSVTGMVAGIVCGNLTAPRTMSVNGNAANCSGSGFTPPALRNGGYCFETTAGQTSSAYFVTY